MGRGPVSLALCALAVSCLAGQQYKFQDLNVPLPPGAVPGPAAAICNKVLGDGTTLFASLAKSAAGADIGSTYVRYASGAWGNSIPVTTAVGVNKQGDLGYNGATVNGNYTQFAGGTVHYADGHEAEVPRPNGYSYSKFQDISDTGLIVGHYSFFDPFGFNYGLPFYIRNNVIYHGSMITSNWGTFVGVDRNGYGLLYDGSAAWWSPETGRIAIPGLTLDDPYYNRPDFNDHLTVITRSHGGYLYSYDLNTPAGVTRVPHPSFFTLDNVTNLEIGGLNNFDDAVCGYCRPINGGQYQYHWALHSGDQWTDLYAAVKSQIPTGWQFGEVKDIDDLGRVYGTMKKPDGSMTIVRLDPVPEPTPLTALGLGALLLRRKKFASNRAA